MMNAKAYPDEGGEDLRPMVRTAASGNLGMWIFGALLLVGGLALFLALDTRRQAGMAPTTTAAGAVGGMIAAPPPLSFPQAYPERAFGAQLPASRPGLRGAAASPATPQVVTRYIERPVLLPDRQEPAGIAPLLPAAPAAQFALPPAPAEQVFDPEERVSAGRLANPSMTVPKGTIIAAVLETALDSSRAGGVRAIVSRDVRSFDGNRILIPRGSRLYGEYAADVSAGQKRAMIEWQRLLRPDGVTIDLNSPSADPLGRAGVQGKVDSNFFARFGGAVLQSVLDIGVALATGAVMDDAVIVNMPASAQQVAGQAVPPPAQPRLRVQQGTSVSVFVARDLDFSSVGG